MVGWILLNIFGIIMFDISYFLKFGFLKVVFVLVLVFRLRNWEREEISRELELVRLRVWWDYGDWLWVEELYVWEFRVGVEVFMIYRVYREGGEFGSNDVKMGDIKMLCILF